MASQGLTPTSLEGGGIAKYPEDPLNSLLRSPGGEELEYDGQGGSPEPQTPQKYRSFPARGRRDAEVGASVSVAAGCMDGEVRGSRREGEGKAEEHEVERGVGEDGSENGGEG